MNFKLFDGEGKELVSGNLETTPEPDIETAGSISLQLPNGNWLSFLISEWSTTYNRPTPVHWGTKEN